MAEGHHGTRVAAAVVVDLVGGIDIPMNDVDAVSGKRERKEARNQRTQTSLPQSSLSGDLTRVVRKATASWMSLQHLLMKRSSCATVWWKATACDLGRKRASDGLQTLKRWSAAGDGELEVMAWGKSLRNVPIYHPMLIQTLWGNE